MSKGTYLTSNITSHTYHIWYLYSTEHTGLQSEQKQMLKWLIWGSEKAFLRSKMDKWVCGHVAEGGHREQQPVFDAEEEVEIFLRGFLRGKGCSTSLQHPYAPEVSLPSFFEPLQGMETSNSWDLTPPAMSWATCMWAGLPRLKKAQADKFQEWSSRKTPP